MNDFNKYFIGMTDKQLDDAIETYQINLGQKKRKNPFGILTKNAEYKPMCDEMPWMRPAMEQGFREALAEKEKRTQQA